ncbi:N-acetylglucosamine kinase [Schumannella soli]|uniref:N-acetylglucosamine kinase n=1 Tax=Schumannella soli TaxID=2590779 RepID=A0A506XX40_9MICO|nr:BadF/BadG/BcrA/BcrD ATPase family protein [Schumannella soli]TPW74252.1 N-acetylglucosamine kinase [Schumannella soli]
MGSVSTPSPADGALPIVLAVDGGGSKTDVVAIDLEGRIVGHARGEGTNPQTKTWASARPTLDALRTAALSEASSTERGERRILATHVYLAGLDLAEELDEGARLLAHWSNADGSPAVVDNDLFALLRSGTLSPDAAVVVCGTGINALAVRADGATARFPALGDISGDWGGGSYLGNRALWHAARAADGRGPATSLMDAVPAALGLASVSAVTEAFHFGRLPAEAVNRLSPVLLDAASAGDEVARGVVDQQADEIVLMATVALRRLGLLEQAVPVVLGGGVLAAQHPLLTARIVSELARLAPHATPVWVTAPPMLGAGLAALEAAGAAPEALARFEREVGAGLLSTTTSVSAEGTREREQV